MYHIYKLNLLIFQRIFNFNMHFIIDNDLLKKSKALKYILKKINDFHRFFGPAPDNKTPVPERKKYSLRPPILLYWTRIQDTFRGLRV